VTRGYWERQDQLIEEREDWPHPPTHESFIGVRLLAIVCYAVDLTESSRYASEFAILAGISALGLPLNANLTFSYYL
jgi:hypothetical protein